MAPPKMRIVSPLLRQLATDQVPNLAAVMAARPIVAKRKFEEVGVDARSSEEVVRRRPVASSSLDVPAAITGVVVGMPLGGSVTSTASEVPVLASVEAAAAEVLESAPVGAVVPVVTPAETVTEAAPVGREIASGLAPVETAMEAAPLKAAVVVAPAEVVMLVDDSPSEDTVLAGLEAAGTLGPPGEVMLKQRDTGGAESPMEGVAVEREAVGGPSLVGFALGSEAEKPSAPGMPDVVECDPEGRLVIRPVTGSGRPIAATDSMWHPDVAVGLGRGVLLPGDRDHLRGLDGATFFARNASQAGQAYQSAVVACERYEELCGQLRSARDAARDAKFMMEAGFERLAAAEAENLQLKVAHDAACDDARRAYLESAEAGRRVAEAEARADTAMQMMGAGRANAGVAMAGDAPEIDAVRAAERARAEEHFARDATRLAFEYYVYGRSDEAAQHGNLPSSDATIRTAFSRRKIKMPDAGEPE